MTAALKDRVALVTGASRGIGYAVASELARNGAHVIAVARTEGGLVELDDQVREAGGSATLVPLDLKDYEGIDRLGAAIFERWGRLDILVGNAGLLGALSPVGHILPSDWENVFAVNVTANWRLLRSLDPLLRQSECGRAVFVTSRVTSELPAYWGTYAASKAALEAIVRTYAAEIRSTSIRANLFSPGPVRTAMRAKAMPGEDPSTLPTPDEVAPAFLELVSADCDRNGDLYDFKTGSWSRT
jgi:NAD(P)-dependent dehydrogenase (short-subunit alcohol dehydrogenase family)